MNNSKRRRALHGRVKGRPRTEAYLKEYHGAVYFLRRGTLFVPDPERPGKRVRDPNHMDKVFIGSTIGRRSRGKFMVGDGQRRNRL